MDSTENIQKQPNEQEQWLSTNEACKYLNISEQTMFRWMKSGKVTYYKVGKSTRFKISDLDMMIEKVVGEEAAKTMSGRCAVCGNTIMVEGKISSTGNVYFKPEKTKFWVWAESTVPVFAKCCTSCGHIQLMADTEKLEKLSPEANNKSEIE
jgi:excisionase family DNA binding protein